MAEKNHIPQHTVLEYRIVLQAPINKVFRLFTPLEEMKWNRNWNPRFLYPENGKIQEDAVFTTQSDGMKTIWIVKMYTTYKHHLAYHRITGDLAAGTVDIKCTPYGEETRANVKYIFTSLSRKGIAYLEQWTQPAFEEYIEKWQNKLNHFLRTGKQLPEE